MSKISYKIGDATEPQGQGVKIIAHICNNENKWGAGFVLALSKKWSEPEAQYRAKKEHNLGDVDLVLVDENIFVANMIAQNGIGYDKNGRPPIRYEALAECLKNLNVVAKKLSASIHMPRIGAGLSGGKWSIISEIIEETLSVPVTVYDLS